MTGEKESKTDESWGPGSTLLLGHMGVYVPKISIMTQPLNMDVVSDHCLPYKTIGRLLIDDSAKDGGPHFTQCMIGICPLLTHSYQNLQLQHKILTAATIDLGQAKETPAGAVCDVICDLVSIDVATEQL